MAQVEIDGEQLIVKIEGLDRLWTFRSRFAIPLEHVRGATLDPGAIRESKGVRAPGTYLPGVITAGTYYVDGERVFWDVRNPNKAVVIELVGERYARLVLQVADPDATVALVEGRIRRVR
jgi:hypothetical protein